MNRHSKVTKDVGEDMQLAPVSMQFRSQAGQTGSFRDDDYSPFKTSSNKTVHVVTCNLSRRPRNSARSGRDSLIQ